MPPLAARLILLASVAATVAPAGAWARPPHADDADDPSPGPVSVRARLLGTTIEVKARFIIEPETPGILLAHTWITVPPGALVTAATATTEGAVHRLPLVAREAAEKAFDAIAAKPPGLGVGVRLPTTSLGPGRTTAIQLSVQGSILSVDLATPRTSRIALDLTLTMPGCFYRDARYALLPDAWHRTLTSPPPLRVDVNDVVDDDLTATCAPPSATGDTWIGFPARELSRRPGGAARIGAIGGRLALGDAQLARVELDLSTQLEQVPDGLHTAIVIDRSRSVTGDEREAQRAIVASYLARVPPHSRVQVIAYARRADALLPAWLTAATAAPRIDRELRALAPRNGSNLDVAIAEAGRWLERTTGARRVIVFTDDRWPDRLSSDPSDALARLLPAGTLVHGVSITGGSGIVRDDELPLAPLARATQGIAVSGGVVADGTPDGMVDATLLVRPISVDHLTVRGAGWDTLETGESSCSETDPTLGEGRSCVWWGTGTPVAGPITIEGELWSKPFARIVRPDPSQARALARILSARGGLDDRLQALADRGAFAINSFWSMLGTWGGGGGYEDLGGIGRSGTGSFGCCSSSIDTGIGTPGVRGHITLDLRKQVEAAVRGCRRGAARAKIVIETTREEIVDVRVEAGGDERLAACLAEAVWEASLAIANAPEHATSRVQL